MMETYDKLFSVIFRHNYYSSGICNEFQVIPDGLTQVLIKKNGFIYRKTPAGFIILSECNTSGSDSFVSNKVEIDQQLNFSVTIKNPYLIDITEIEEPESESVLLFSNEVVSENGKSHLFNSGNYVQLTTNNFIVNKGTGPIGIFKRNGIDIPLKYEIKEDTICYLTSGLDSGVYRYQSDSEQKYFYLSSRSIGSKPFAIISIKVNQESVLDQDSKMKHPDYTLQLETKETFWQYILNLTQKPDNLVIESSGSSEDFIKTGETISDNKKVFIFTSKQEIPIKEERDDYFRLILRNGDPANDLILISKLPLPEMGVLNNKRKGKLFTPIYVNF